MWNLLTESPEDRGPVAAVQALWRDLPAPNGKADRARPACERLRGFVDWLCRQRGPDGRRLCDRSVYNAVLPLRACLRHAHGAGLVVDDVGAAITLPRRRRGRTHL